MLFLYVKSPDTDFKLFITPIPRHKIAQQREPINLEHITIIY
jgi:hypothetical protein